MKTIIKYCLTTLFSIVIVLLLQRVLEQQSVPKKLLDSNILQQALKKLPFLVKKDGEKAVNDQNSSQNSTYSSDVNMKIDEIEPKHQTQQKTNTKDSLVIFIENIDSLREAIKLEQVVLIAKKQDKTFVLDASGTVRTLSSDVTRSTKITPYFVTSNLVEYYKDDFLIKGVSDMTQVRVYMTTDLINLIAKNTTEISLPYY